MLEITSPKNPIIKEIKGLYKKRERWQNKLFIMEGIKIIEEALENNINIRYIVLNANFMESIDGQAFYDTYIKFPRFIVVNDNLFKEISDTENPQGVLGVGEFRINSIKENIGALSSLLFLNGIQDPGNMGTIIRSCDAFKLDGIIIGEDCVDVYNPKVIRATMGSIFRVPIYYANEDIDCLMDLKKDGFKIYATSLGGSLPNYEIDYNTKYAIVIGNEARGVDEKILGIADSLMKIPMLGNAESLNAGVAASIIMYEAMKQRETGENF